MAPDIHHVRHGLLPPLLGSNVRVGAARGVVHAVQMRLRRKIEVATPQQLPPNNTGCQRLEVGRDVLPLCCRVA